MQRVTRRQVVAGVGAVGLALVAGCGRWPGQAAEPAPAHRLGYLSTQGAEVELDRLRRALSDIGYVEGHNLVMEPYVRLAAPGGSRTAAEELVQIPVDIIVTAGISNTVRASNATSVIPIVQAAGGGDLVARGLAESLGKPGGNVTGVNELSPQLAGKRLELLRDAVPTASAVAILWSAPNQEHALELAELQAAARALGLQPHLQGVQTPDELQGAIEAAGRASVVGFYILADSLTHPREPQIAELALENHLPSMYPWRSYADVGGLMAYGPDRLHSARRAAYYIDRIFRGAKPAELPIEQPREFEFVINLKTAHALGLTIPQSVLLQATEVIQ